MTRGWLCLRCRCRRPLLPCPAAGGAQAKVEARLWARSLSPHKWPAERSRNCSARSVARSLDDSLLSYFSTHTYAHTESVLYSLHLRSAQHITNCGSGPAGMRKTRWIRMWMPTYSPHTKPPVSSRDDRHTLLLLLFFLSFSCPIAENLADTSEVAHATEAHGQRAPPPPTMQTRDGSHPHSLGLSHRVLCCWPRCTHTHCRIGSTASEVSAGVTAHGAACWPFQPLALKRFEGLTPWLRKICPDAS